jgi:hypothetical protein
MKCPSHCFNHTVPDAIKASLSVTNEQLHACALLGSHQVIGISLLFLWHRFVAIDESTQISKYKSRINRQE